MPPVKVDYENSADGAEMRHLSIIIFMTGHRLDCDAGREPKGANEPNGGDPRGNLASARPSIDKLVK